MPTIKRWWDIKVKGGYNAFRQHRINLSRQDLVSASRTSDHATAEALNVMYLPSLIRLIS